MQPATTFLTAGAQPVYVATQPRLVAAAQPALLEQQVMRTPQMATVPHLYNVHHPQAQVVAAPVLRQQIIPAVAPQQYVNAETIKVVEQQPRAGEEVSQQYHSQDEFGNYSYGYANNNSEKQEVGNTRSGQVKGHYTYVDGAGRNRRVDYVADNNGFRAAGDGINKIKREAEPEAKPEAKAEAEPEADPKMVQMTSYVNNNGKQEGIKMSSYMTDNTMQHQQQPSMRMSSMMRPSSMMTYTNDMSSMPMSNPMVYMSMNAPGGATLTASRMTNNNNMYNMQQRNHQMDNMRMMDSMRMDNMGMDNMRMDRNDIMMRRNNMLNMGRNDMRMNTMGMNNRDMYRMMNHRAGLRGQQQQQYLNNMHRGRDMLMRDSMFKTNPSNNFMEIQQFEMKPNYNYRFDF